MTDQELEACEALILQMRPHGGRAWTDEQAAVYDALTAAAVELRNARRPKAEPPSLKEQALEDLNTLLAALNRHGMVPNIYTIRRALETLDD